MSYIFLVYLTYYWYILQILGISYIVLIYLTYSYFFLTDEVEVLCFWFTRARTRVVQHCRALYTERCTQGAL